MPETGHPAPDLAITNGWQLRVHSPRYYASLTACPLQATLLCPGANSELCDDILYFADQNQLDYEVLAYRSIRPERLALHEIIAQLNTRVLIPEDEHITAIIERTYPQFMNDNAQLFKPDPLKDIHKTRRCSHSRFEAWATVHKNILASIQPAVQTFIDQLIAAGSLQPAQITPDAIGFAVTGGVASGKSSALGIIKDKLGDAHYQFISSDELINSIKPILGETAQANYSKYLPKLCMAEIWHIKNRMYQILQATPPDKRPHLVIEGMSPRDTLDILNRCGYSTTQTFANTSEPSLAVVRAEQRAQKEDRHVSSAATAASYKDTWNSTYLHLAKYATQWHDDDDLSSDTTLCVTDTDLFYAKNHGSPSDGIKAANILYADSSGIQINNLSRLLRLIHRGHLLNHATTQPRDMWHSRAPCRHQSLAETIKLFDLDIPIMLNGREIKQPELIDACKKILAANTIRRCAKSQLFRRSWTQWAKKSPEEKVAYIAATPSI